MNNTYPEYSNKGFYVMTNKLLCLFKEADGGSIADMLRATAEEAMTQTGFVFDETTGMYYDHSTGFYYDSVRQTPFSSKINSVSYLSDIVCLSFDFMCVFLLLLRPVSCTMMPTQAFITTMMRRVDDTSFIPGLRCPLHKRPQSFAKTRALVKRRAKSWRKGLRKQHTRTIRYVTPGSFLMHFIFGCWQLALTL